MNKFSLDMFTFFVKGYIYWKDKEMIPAAQAVYNRKIVRRFLAMKAKIHIVLSVIIAVLLIATIVIVAPRSNSTQAAATLIQTFDATADAYTSSVQPSTNFGTDTALKIKSTSPVNQSYLQFNINGLTAPIANAKLRLYVNDPSAGGNKVYQVSNDWQESTITYKNAPVLPSTVIIQGGAAKLNNWIEYDVTSAVTGNGAISFALSSTNFDLAGFNSREASTNKPQLIVTQKDIVPPIANIILPNGQNIVVNNGSILLDASASDNVAVTKLDFYSNNNFLGTSSCGIFGCVYTWNTANVADGKYDITAKAYDAAGNVGISNPVTLFVLNHGDSIMPTTNLIIPAANAIQTGSNVQADAIANDNIAVIKVDIYVDGNYQCTTYLTYFGYICYWDSTKKGDGTHSVTSQAYDEVNNMTKSAPISVTVVNNKPSANFTQSTSTGIAPFTVSFTDQSSGFAASRNWDFGDGSSSASINPVHIYSVPGTYTPVLTLTNSIGTSIAIGSVITVSPFNRPNRKTGATRVKLIGDSITQQYQAYAAPALTNSGYNVSLNFFGGTGLLDNWACDGTAFQNMVTNDDPDIVVIEYVGNYQLAPSCQPGLTEPSPEFYNAWRAKAVQDTNNLLANGARVYWMLAPGMLNDPQKSFVFGINQIYSNIAASTPGVGTVDEYTPFGGGTWDQSLRSTDGVHLNDAGSQLMSQGVVNAVINNAPVTSNPSPTVQPTPTPTTQPSPTSPPTPTFDLTPSPTLLP